MPKFDFFFEYDDSPDSVAHTIRETGEFPNIAEAVAWAQLMCVTANDDKMTYEKMLDEMLAHDDDYDSPSEKWDDCLSEGYHPAHCSVAPHVEAVVVEIENVYAKFSKDLADRAKAAEEESELETLKKLAAKHGKKLS